MGATLSSNLLDSPLTLEWQSGIYWRGAGGHINEWFIINGNYSGDDVISSITYNDEFNNNDYYGKWELNKRGVYGDIQAGKFTATPTGCIFDSTPIIKSLTEAGEYTISLNIYNGPDADTDADHANALGGLIFSLSFSMVTDEPDIYLFFGHLDPIYHYSQMSGAGYYVTSPLFSSLTVTEYFNDTVLGTYNRDTGDDNIYRFGDFESYFDSAPMGEQQTLKISATDGTYTVNATGTFIKRAESIITGGTDLGEIYNAQTLEYTIDDPDSSSHTIYEFFDYTRINEIEDRILGTYAVTDWTSYFNSASVGQHTITIETDDYRETSETTWSFTKVVNAQPIISGSDSNLGILYSAQIINYTISDIDNNSFTVTEYFDFTVIGTYTKNAGTEYSVANWQNYFDSAIPGQHTIQINVSDGINTVTRTYTFTKPLNPISFVNTGSLSLGTIDDILNVNFTVENTLSNITNAIIKIDDSIITSLNPVQLNINIPLSISSSTISSLKKGNHTLNIIATDSENNTNTLTYTFTKSNNIANISAAKFDFGVIADAPVISYSVNEIDGDTLTANYKLDGNLITSNNVTNGNVSFNTNEYFSDWSNGEHILTVTIDDSGQDSNTLSFTFSKVDNYISFNTTTTDIGSVSQLFNLSFNVYNTLNNSTNVVIKIDDTIYKTINNVSLVDAITVSIDSETYTGLSIGDHVINVIATDSANMTNTLAYTFKKDPNAPLITGVDTNLGKINIAPSISYIVTDPNDLQNTVNITLDGNTVVSNKTIVLGTEYVQYFTNEFDSLSEGIHTIKVITTNGTLSTARTFKFTKIDKVIVVSTTQSNLGSLSNGFDINYLVTNQLENVVYYTIQIDGTLYQGSTVATQNVKQTVSISDDTFDSLSKGDHLLVINFLDSANNVNSITYTFTKEAVAPRISGSDTDFGDVSITPHLSYIITNADNDPTDVIINFDNTTIKTINDIELGKLYKLDYDTQFNNAGFGKHTITITAKSPTLTTIRKYEFNKLSTSIIIDFDMNQIKPQMNNFNNIKMNIQDEAGPKVTLNVYIDSTKVESILDITNGDYVYNMPSNIWSSIEDGIKQVKLEFISHTNGSKNNINFTMNKVGGYIDFTLKNPIKTENIPYRILADANYYIAPGAIFEVLVTNNPFALNPIWENMTNEFLNGDYHVFDNSSNDGLINGFNIRFKVDVGSSSELSYIGQFGIFYE